MTELFRKAGFVNIGERDVTAAFARSTRAYLETSEQYRRELSDSWGAEKFAESQRDRRATLALVKEGVLRRGLFTGRRPK